MRSSIGMLSGLTAVVTSLLLHSSATAAAVTSAEAPPTLPPAWSLQLDGEVEWQRVIPLGQLLVKTSHSQSALDPARGRVLWTHADLGGLAQDQYEEIPGTTLVVLSDGLARPRAVILDSVGGLIIFDSRAAGVTQVLSRHFLPKSRGLLLFGFREGDPAATMFLADIESSSLRWKNGRLLEGQGKMVQALAAFFQAATNQSGIVGEPMEITPDAFLVASVTDFYTIRTRAGEIAWRAANARDTRKTRFYATEKAPGVVFVGSETTMSITASAGSNAGSVESVYSEYTARRMADGAAVWPKPIRLEGGLNDVFFTDGGLVLSPRTTGKRKILLCDYGSGESRWGKKGKGIEILGGIINHDSTRAGLVLTTGYDSAWTDKGTQYHLTLLDVENGALRFEEPLRLRCRIVSTRVIPAGLLFTTTSEVNILDLKTGQPLLGEGVRSDESLVTAVSGWQLYAYAGREGTLHRLDLDRGTLATPSKAPVRLEEDEASGRIEAVIDLGRDKDPIYDVDAVSNLIFYRSIPNTVAGYRF